MVNKSNKRNNIPYYIRNNIPYYITAFSATLLFAGIVVFAVAPYIEFLTPIAALGFDAPLIAAFAIPLTMLVFALSYNAVRQNKALAEKETQLAGKEEEIEAISKTIAEQETQLVKKTEEIEAQNQTLAEIKAQLTGKTEKIKAQNQTLAEIKAQLTGKTEKIKAQNQTLAEIKAQLAEKDRMLQEEDNRSAESLFENISGDGVVQPKGNHNETAAQSRVKSTKAVSKQKESNRFNTKAKALGALSVISAIAASGVPNYPFYLSNAISPANDSTNVGDLHNNYCPNSLYTHPNNTQTRLDDKLNQTEATLEISKEKAKKGFNVDPQKHNFVNGTALEKSTLINDTGIVAQNMLTSLYSRVKNAFFSLFTSEDTTYNPESYTNGIAYEAASKKQADAVNEVVGSTQVGQNDPAKNCIVLNTRQYDNQTVAPTPCPLSTYQVPLPGLRHVALCCPSITKSAPPSGP